jgi:plastocyanin
MGEAVKARLGITALALAVPVVAVGVAGAERAPAPAAARTVDVRVGDNFYRPGRLSVPPRTRVRWNWRGDDVHDVFVSSGPRRFKSRRQVRGSFARTLRARGTYRIFCTVHGQSMRMRIRVR